MTCVMLCRTSATKSVGRERERVLERPADTDLSAIMQRSWGQIGNTCPFNATHRPVTSTRGGLAWLSGARYPSPAATIRVCSGRRADSAPSGACNRSPSPAVRVVCRLSNEGDRSRRSISASTCVRITSVSERCHSPSATLSEIFAYKRGATTDQQSGQPIIPGRVGVPNHRSCGLYRRFTVGPRQGCQEDAYEKHVPHRVGRQRPI